MQRPIRPSPEPTGPSGVVTRPGGPATRPINVNRPVYNRPTNVVHNTVINSRPSWANINNTQINSIHNHWHNAFVGPGARPGVGLADWGRYHPNRVAYWNNWGNSVRYHWNGYHNHNNWFNYNWWCTPSGEVGTWLCL